MTIQYGLSDVWVSDSFRKMSKKAYTFDNGRSRSGAAISRIDKYMISQGLESRGGRIESAASIEKFSDHSPLLISIWGQATDPVNPSYYFDTSLLEDAEAKAELFQAWSGDLPTPSNNQDWTPWLEAASAG
jgi:single-stranded DNA-specific DHH superfamily exonuclease